MTRFQLQFLEHQAMMGNNFTSNGDITMKIKTALLQTILAMALMATTSTSMAIGYTEEDVSFGHVLVDAVIVRPLTFLTTAAGAVAWTVTLPFSILGENAEEAGEFLVVEPATYTFVRPIGRFEENNNY